MGPKAYIIQDLPLRKNLNYKVKMRLAGFSECPASMGPWCINLLVSQEILQPTASLLALLADCTSYRGHTSSDGNQANIPEGMLEMTLSAVFWLLTAELGYKRNQTLKWSCSRRSPGGWLVKNPFSLPPPPTTLLLPRHLRANRDSNGPIPKPRGTHLSNALFIQL